MATTFIQPISVAVLGDINIFLTLLEEQLVLKFLEGPIIRNDNNHHYLYIPIPDSIPAEHHKVLCSVVKKLYANTDWKSITIFKDHKQPTLAFDLQYQQVATQKEE